MIKRLAYYIVSIACVAFSSYLMPGFLLFAFNYGKGIQNNEDGIMFIPVGFILVGLTVFLNVIVVRKVLKMQQDSRHKKLLVVLVLLAIVIVSVIVTETTWALFFKCLAHYKGLNLGLQR